MSTTISSPHAPLLSPLVKTLAWKDYREQRAIWLAIAILAVVLPLGIATLARGGIAYVHQDIGVIEMIYGCLMALIVGQGIVCGAQLFAGETDAGSLVFLDTLSCQRLPVWRTKLLVGALFTLLQTVVVISVSIYLTPRWVDAANFAWLAIVGWLALLWGTVGGVICQRVFPAILLGIALLLANFALLLVIPLVRELVQIALAVVPLVLSYRIFCAADIQRFRAAGNVDMSPRRAPRGLLTMLWLAHRQGRWIVWPGLAVCLVAGYLIQGNLDFLWPLGTLVIGLVCGLATFAPEQTSEQERFLGAQRFPPGRIWPVKTAFWALAAIGMAAFYLLAMQYGLALAGNRTGSRTFTGLLSPDGNLTLYTVEWLIYGFACGQFAALLARRILVSIFLAVVITVFLLIWWLPSLVFGGIQAWQILMVPILLLIGARLAMWIWLTGRLYTGRHWLLLAACGLAIGLWIGANLWYRAVEIPDVGEPFDLQAFNAELRQAANSEANDLMRAGLAAFRVQLQSVDEKLTKADEKLAKAMLDDRFSRRRKTPIRSDEFPGPDLFSIDDYLAVSQQIFQQGWLKNAKKMNVWLDAMFMGQWANDFRKAAIKPLGLLVDPRTFDGGDIRRGRLLADIFEYDRINRLFAVRSMQMMVRGDERAALDNLDVLLGLSRQYQHCYPTGGLGWPAGAAETAALRGFDFLIHGGRQKVDILRDALAILQEHEKNSPDPLDYIKANYIIIKNDPERFFGYKKDDSGLGVTLVRLALEAPWEEERQLRLINAAFQGALRFSALSPRQWIRSDPANLGLDLTDSGWTLEQWSRLRLLRMQRHIRWPLYEPQSNYRTLRRNLLFRQLQIALMLYQVDAGHAAANLDDLVPRYLAKMPLDPVNGEPFNYEVSKGEEVKGDFPRIWGSANTLRLQPGQGVLWIGEAEERTWYPVPMVASEKK